MNKNWDPHSVIGEAGTEVQADYIKQVIKSAQTNNEELGNDVSLYRGALLILHNECTTEESFLDHAEVMADTIFHGGIFLALFLQE